MSETIKNAGTVVIDKKMAGRILNSRKILKSPGTAKSIRVTSVTEWEGKFIVNLKAMAGDQAKEAVKLFKSGQYQDAVNSNLSVSVLDGQYCPQKGDFVDITLGYVPNRDRTGEVLRVIGMTPIAAAETDSLNLDFEDDPELDD